MAETTITNLPNAAALTGSERVPMDQGGTTVDATTADIAATLPNATTSTAGKMTAAQATLLGTALQPGQAIPIDEECRNNSGVGLTAGAPVYITGSSGTKPTVALADASSEITAARSLGLVVATVGNNADCTVRTRGRLTGINTSTLTEGAAVWLSETTGQLTSTRPTQPAHGVFFGFCVKQAAGTAGIIYINVINGQELDELHDVLISSAAEGQVLRRAADGLWKNHTLTASNVGADPAGSAAAVSAALSARLDQFRDAATFHASKRISASNSNNGTSEGEAFLTIGAAVAAANAYVTANPGAKAKIFVGPGRFIEASLPLRLKPNILIQGALQRATVIQPAAGEELNSFLAVDSGCMICDLTFAGHQAQDTSPTDSTVGTRAWAIRFNELANGGTGVFLTASPYIKDCLSLTAEDDAGEAGSTSTGDCGGGVEVDGAKCAPNSPVRSMVVYGFTQQNLGGPGIIVKNDAYAELVSFFGLFGTWHVRAETGGQATMSGGGCSEFGTYGLMADGYSPTPIFTGALLADAAQGATTVDVGNLSANRIGSASRPGPGQLMLLAGTIYVVQSATPITGGFRVAFYSPTSVGLAAAASTGAAVNFRLRSQISAGCHTMNYVGSGTNYSALPQNGGVPIRANETVETNYGRIFGATVNDVGDFKIAGGAFAVDGTTGAVTINTSSFNLSGLNAVGPFSRNGGISTVGVQLQEVSNNTSLLASTGVSDGNTAPTQAAVRSFTTSRFLQGLTVTAGQPITLSDTSTTDSDGFQIRNRNINLSVGTTAGSVAAGNDSRLSDDREWTAETVTQAEAEGGTGTTRRAWTAQRVRQAVENWWSGARGAPGAIGESAPSTGRFSRLGVGGVPSRTGYSVALGSGVLPRAQVVTAVGSTYTCDIRAANRFMLGAAIAGNTTIEFTNVADLAVAGGFVEYVEVEVDFRYTSGVITISAAGFTTTWDGNTAATPTAGEIETLIVRITPAVAGTPFTTPTAYVAPMRGRA